MKRKTTLAVLLIVLILAAGWFAWQKLSDRHESGGKTPGSSESGTIPVITENSADALPPPETRQAESADSIDPDDVPEGDAQAPSDDPDLSEGDAKADDLPEGDADDMPEGDAYVPADGPDTGGDEDLPAGDSTVNTAPDFTVLDMDGQELRLSDLFGQRILINFWATWCPPCRAELPYFEEAYQEYGKDIVFLMVDLTDGRQETIDGVKAFAAENGYSFPVYYDTEFSAAYAYGIDAIPQTYAIGPDGNILMSQVGSMSKARLKEFTDALSEKH